MKFFKYSHFNVHYVENKVDNPKGVILFLPGFGAHCEGSGAKTHQVEGYSFYSLSYPGHGHTIAHSSLEFNIELYAQVVIALIDKLGLKDLTLVGHSMGGAIATLVYAQRAKNIKKLLLISPLNSTIQTHQGKLYPLFFPKSCREYVEVAREFHPFLDHYLKSPCFKHQLAEMVKLANTDSLYSRGMKGLAASFFEDELLLKLDQATKKINQTFYLFYGSLESIVNRHEMVRHYTFISKHCIPVELADVDHSPWVDNLQTYLTAYHQFLSKE